MMGKRNPLLAFAVFYLLVTSPLMSQAVPAADPASYIGLTLGDLIGRMGTPRSVYPVRGVEEWQDDVIFMYDEGDFYILKDRVWQLCLKSAYRIQAGDPRSAVFLSFGEPLSAAPDYAVFPLSGKNWPMALRCNFDPLGKVEAIFIYRSDL